MSETPKNDQKETILVVGQSIQLTILIQRLKEYVAVLLGKTDENEDEERARAEAVALLKPIEYQRPLTEEVPKVIKERALPTIKQAFRNKLVRSSQCCQKTPRRKLTGRHRM